MFIYCGPFNRYSNYIFIYNYTLIPLLIPPLTENAKRIRLALEFFMCGRELIFLQKLLIHLQRRRIDRLIELFIGKSILKCSKAQLVFKFYVCDCCMWLLYVIVACDYCMWLSLLYCVLRVVSASIGFRLHVTLHNLK